MHEEPHPPPNTLQERFRAILLAHPESSVLFALVLIAAYITWPIYADKGSPVAWIVSVASLSLLLLTLERTFAAPRPYHYFWGAACCILGVLVPVFGSIYFERPTMDVVVNAFLAGAPIVGAIAYRLLRG